MSSRARAVAALEAVIDETRSLFHRLKRAAEDVHGHGELSAGLRGLLMSLERHGPRTVPQMARARPVSRQHVQTLVNRLLEQDLVELVDNPAHKRSRLVRLTRRGRATIQGMTRREASVFAGIAAELDAAELEHAAAALRQVRQAFTGESWERAKSQIERPDTGPGHRTRKPDPDTGAS